MMKDHTDASLKIRNPAMIAKTDLRLEYGRILDIFSCFQSFWSNTLERVQTPIELSTPIITIQVSTSESNPTTAIKISEIGTPHDSPIRENRISESLEKLSAFL